MISLLFLWSNPRSIDSHPTSHLSNGSKHPQIWLEVFGTFDHQQLQQPHLHDGSMIPKLKKNIEKTANPFPNDGFSNDLWIIIRNTF